MPLRPCLEPGCPNLVRSGRCPAHQRRHDNRPTRRVYLSAKWKRVRAAALAAAEHQCCAIEHGRRCAARDGLQVHHDYPGGLDQLLADGADPYSLRWLIVLCRPHHRRREQQLRRDARVPSPRR